MYVSVVIYKARRLRSNFTFLVNRNSKLAVLAGFIDFHGDSLIYNTIDHLVFHSMNNISSEQ